MDELWGVVLLAAIGGFVWDRNAGFQSVVTGLIVAFGLDLANRFFGQGVCRMLPTQPGFRECMERAADFRDSLPNVFTAAILGVGIGFAISEFTKQKPPPQPPPPAPPGADS